MLEAFKNKLQFQSEGKQESEANISKKQGTITIKGKSLAEFLK